MLRSKSTAERYEAMVWNKIGTVGILLMGLWLAIMLNTSFVSANTIKIVITK